MVTDDAAEAERSAHGREGGVGRTHAEGVEASEAASVHRRLPELEVEVVGLSLGRGGLSGGLLLRGRGRGGGHRDGRGGRPGEGALVEDDGAADDVVGHVEVEVVLGARHGEEQLGEVVGVEGGRLRGKARGEVGEADVRHVVVDVNLEKKDGMIC